VKIVSEIERQQNRDARL